MKFWATLPGLSRWPSASFAVPGANWEEHPAAADFQRIAAAADRLGFDSVSVHDFEIAMHAVPTLIGPDHRPVAGAQPPAAPSR